MRLGTHMRAARSAKGLTVAASSQVTGISMRRLADIEEGDRLPTGNELGTFAAIHSLDSPSVFLWGCHELLERLMARSSAAAWTPDEDLFELWDYMVAYLAQRDRI